SARRHRRSFFLFRNLRDKCFGGEQQARDGRSVLQRGARDFGRIDDTRLHQVGVVVIRDVVTFVAFALLHFLNDERAFAARVVSKLTRRLFNGTANNRHADFFIAFEVLDVIERFLRAQQRDTAAWDDAFLNRRTRGVQRVFDPSFLLFHLGLSRSADVDDCDTACEFRQALLQFLAIVIAGRLFNLTTDLCDAALDIGFFAFAFDNGGVLLVDSNALGLAEVLELDVLKLDAEIFGDATPTGEHRDIFQHRLATIAEARSFDRTDLQRAAQFVYDQSCERFAFHVFRDDEQRPSSFRDFLKQREHVLQARDFLLVNQDVRIFEDRFHLLRVGDEVGRQITFVELHTLDDFQRGLDRFRFLNRDRAVLADLVHGDGDDFADRLVPVGRNGRDLCDLGAVADFLGD